MSSVHTRNSITWPVDMVCRRGGMSNMPPLPGRLEHVSRVAHPMDPVESELDPMIGTCWRTPDHDVMRPAVPDECRPQPDRLRASVRFGVVELRNVVLRDAAFENMHGLWAD